MSGRLLCTKWFARRSRKRSRSAPVRAAKFLRLLPASATVEQRVLQARVDIAEQRYSIAVQELEKLPKASPDNLYDSQYWLAKAQSELGLLAVSEGTLDHLLASKPDHQLALELKVALTTEQRTWQTAIEAQTRLTQLRPGAAGEQCHLGDLFLRSKNLEKAQSPLLKGLQLDEYAFLCHRDLGELYRVTGRGTQAVHELEWVVRFFPEGDAKTYISLALAYQAARRQSDAESVLEKGRRLFPNDQLLQKFSLPKN